MLKKLIIGFLIVVLFAGGLLFWLNTHFLPKKIHAVAETSLSTSLQRQVTIENLHFSFFQGFVLEGLTIQDDPAFSEATFAQIKRISGSILLLPLVKKQIIIPSVKIEAPTLNLIQNKDDQWNFETLKPKSDKAAEPSKFQIITPRIRIQDGTLKAALNPEQALPPLQLSNFNLNVGLNLPANIQWKLTTDVDLKQSATISVEGDFDLPSGKVTVTQKAQANLADLKAYLPKDLRDQVYDISGDTALLIEATGPAKGPIAITGSLAVPNLDGRIPSPIKEQPSTMHIQANCNWSFSADVTPGSETLPPIQMELAVTDAQLAHLPYLNTLQDLSGTFELNGLNATWKDVQAQHVLQSQARPLQSSGTYNLKTHAIDAQLQMGFELSEFIARPEISLPELFKQVQGETSAELSLSGAIDALQIAGEIRSEELRIELLNTIDVGWQDKPETLQIQTLAAIEFDAALNKARPAFKLETQFDNMAIYPLPYIEQIVSGQGSCKLNLDESGKNTIDANFKFPWKLDALATSFNKQIQTASGDAISSVQLSGALEDMSLEATTTIPELTVTLRHPLKKLQPDINPLTISARTDMGFKAQAQGDQPSQFSMDMALEDIQLTPLPFLDALHSGKGALKFNSLKAFETDFSFSTASEMPLAFSAKGNLAKDAWTQAQLQTQLDFTTLLDWIPPARQLQERFPTQDGQVKVDADVALQLSNLKHIEPKANITFEQIKLLDPTDQGIETLSGTLQVTPTQIVLDEARGKAWGASLELDASINQWDTRPEISADFYWSDVDAHTAMTLEEKTLHIHEFTGKTTGSSVRVVGTLMDLPKPKSNLLLEGKLELSELRAWLKDNKALESLSPQGLVGFRVLQQGRLQEPRAWTTDVKLNANTLALKGIPLEDFQLELLQDETQIDLNRMTALLAQGQVSTFGTLDIEPERPTWQSELKLRQIDIAELLPYLEIKQKLSGRLDLNWKGIGAVGSPEQMAGKGNIVVSGGRLLELPLLGPFGEFIQLPNLRQIAFEQMASDFEIKTGRVYTENLRFDSPQMTADIRGSGGFLKGKQSTIDFTLVPNFKKESITKDGNPLEELILKGSEYLGGEIQLRGTWEKPEKTFIAKPVTNLIEELPIKDILEGLF